VPDLTLVLPPLTQLNTPYPSIAFLARFLRPRGFDVALRDLGLELALRVWSRGGLARVFDALSRRPALPPPATRALALREAHLAAIDPVVAFLQGKDRTVGPRIVGSALLPRTPRLEAPQVDVFGPHATDDTARHLATLYLADLAELVALVDEGFALARYHSRLAEGFASFDALEARLGGGTLLDAWLDELGDTLDGPLVGISVPFPGNVYGALRLGRRLRARGVRVVMGGGWVNTELRDVDEPRLWDCVDAVTYDDGEAPLLALLEGCPPVRTRTRDGYAHHAGPALGPTFSADYGGLPLGSYLQLVDGTNPAHRLWSDGRWNKVLLAHGCYWKKCAFCDINLDYIAGYAPAEVERLVDEMARLVDQTGQRGFHFVDEAMPPARMRDLALALLRRGLSVTWWGNIRFERAFTPDLARLCAASGLVGVTGGLEVASDRLLARMAKGVTIAQVANSAAAFSAAGVMVHAYLMYGFPTETEQETLDAMEVVRQLFEAGVLDSAFWHRFVLTRHSGMHGHGAEYGFTQGPPGRFATNDVPHDDGLDHDRFDAPLVAALDAWMRGEALDRPVTTWFDRAVPEPAVPTALVREALAQAQAAPGATLVWIGARPVTTRLGLELHHADGTERLHLSPGDVAWLCAFLGSLPGPLPEDVPAAVRRQWRALRRAGLLAV
jgi:hypothetical protein